MAKKPREIPAKELALYEKLVATNPNLKVKGAASAYTSLNGHMFSFMTKEGILALRLSPEDQEAFVAKFKTKPCIQYGAVMRGYVEVPPSLFKKTKEVQKYFERSYAYIGSLKPKPTTKAKKTSSTKSKKTSTAKSTTKKKPEKKQKPVKRNATAAKKNSGVKKVAKGKSKKSKARKKKPSK